MIAHTCSNKLGIVLKWKLYKIKAYESTRSSAKTHQILLRDSRFSKSIVSSFKQVQLPLNSGNFKHVGFINFNSYEIISNLYYLNEINHS